MRTAFENQGAHRGKENKTPGGEHQLNPPGVELLAWLKNQPSNSCRDLVPVRREGNFINYHVVALSHVVNVNL
jgi:hypothetical protein